MKQKWIKLENNIEIRKNNTENTIIDIEISNECYKTKRY